MITGTGTLATSPPGEFSRGCHRVKAVLGNFFIFNTILKFGNTIQGPFTSLVCVNNIQHVLCVALCQDMDLLY